MLPVVVLIFACFLLTPPSLPTVSHHPPSVVLTTALHTTCPTTSLSYSVVFGIYAKPNGVGWVEHSTVVKRRSASPWPLFVSALVRKTCWQCGKLSSTRFCQQCSLPDTNWREAEGIEETGHTSLTFSPESPPHLDRPSLRFWVPLDVVVHQVSFLF